MIIFPRYFPVTCHTDHVSDGTIFVAIKGMNSDGILFVSDAIKRGSRHIVISNDAFISEDIANIIQQNNVIVDRVNDTRLALAKLSAREAGYPAKQLKILAVTGTKGKTTSVYVLRHILKSAGYRTALLSTVKNSILDVDFVATLTTAQPDYLQQFLRLCVDQKIEYVIMEVAAQALTLHRIAGIEFDGLIFTNLDQEHAEFYNSMDDYFDAKLQIFKQLKKDAHAIVNIDNDYGQKIVNHFSHVKTISLQISSVDFYGQLQQVNFNQSILKIISKNNAYEFNYDNLPGIFNAYNILGVVSLLLCNGITQQQIMHGLSIVERVPGRLETYTLNNGAIGIIDYAHTPSSYESVLSMISKWTNHLIVVFGAGGGRDVLKRPMMGAIAAKYGQVIIITSDNPRMEDPKNIADQILVGISLELRYKVTIELDREYAIKYAYASSRQDSIVILLGKGPDEYQIIGLIKYPFSEKTILLGL